MSATFDHYVVNGSPVIGSPTPSTITFILASDTVVTAVYMGITALIATWPASTQQSGASLQVTFTFSNHGADGSFIFTLKNGTTTLGTATISAAAGTTGNVGLINFTMPAADASLVLTSNYGGEADASIQVLKLVATTLTLTLPASVLKGASVSFSGQLTRADGGSPGVEVIQIINGSTVFATVNTAANGSYSGSFTAPTNAGNYVFQASFAGSGLLAASLSLVRGVNMRRRLR